MQRRRTTISPFRSPRPLFRYAPQGPGGPERKEETPLLNCPAKADHLTVIRSDDTFGKSHKRTREPIEDKESYRWLEHFNALQDYFSPYPGIEVHSVCDREGDFYELFAARQTKNVHLLVRSQYKRVLKDEPQFDIHSKVAASPVRSTYKLNITDEKHAKNVRLLLVSNIAKCILNSAFPINTKKVYLL